MPPRVGQCECAVRLNFFFIFGVAKCEMIHVCYDDDDCDEEMKMRNVK